jgi:hypothetical protein
MIQRDDDEGVADFFVGDEFRDFRDRHEARDQIFAAIEFHAVLQATVFNQHSIGDVAQDGGIGMNFSEQACAVAYVAGLLAQFAHGGRHRVGLARVHHAAGNLQLDGVRAVTILLDHHKSLVGRDGDDVDPVDAVEDEEVVFLASARGYFEIRSQLENAEIADEFGTDFFPRFNHAEILTQRRKDAEEKVFQLRNSCFEQTSPVA